MSRISRVTTVIAALAVAGMVAACGATTQNPAGAGSSSQNSSESSTEAPAGSGTSSESAAESSSEQTSSSSAAGEAEPQPLNLNLAKDDALAGLLPKAIADKGTLTIATDASYAPNEFLKNGQGEPIGMDIDLGNAVAQLLGLKTQWQNTGFDGIIAGLAAGRYDLSLSSFTDTKKREEQVNFVTYLEAGVSIVVAKGNPKGVQSSEDLCGLKVGAENGTIETDMLTKEDVDDSVVKICKDAGKPAPQFSGYPTQSDVNTALASDRIDGYMADTPVAEYAVKVTGDKFEKVGKDVGVAPYGIAIPKEPAELTTAVQKAMQKLMDSGDYGKILSNWGLDDAGIKTAEINKAIY
jgi:polar amino acid transport system substrate-binding protein